MRTDNVFPGLLDRETFNDDDLGLLAPTSPLSPSQSGYSSFSGSPSSVFSPHLPGSPLPPRLDATTLAEVLSIPPNSRRCQELVTLTVGQVQALVMAASTNLREPTGVPSEPRDNIGRGDILQMLQVASQEPGARSSEVSGSLTDADALFNPLLHVQSASRCHEGRSSLVFRITLRRSRRCHGCRPLQ